MGISHSWFVSGPPSKYQTMSLIPFNEAQGALKFLTELIISDQQNSAISKDFLTDLLEEILKANDLQYKSLCLNIVTEILHKYGSSVIEFLANYTNFTLVVKSYEDHISAQETLSLFLCQLLNNINTYKKEQSLAKLINSINNLDLFKTIANCDICIKRSFFSQYLRFLKKNRLNISQENFIHILKNLNEFDEKIQKYSYQILIYFFNIEQNSSENANKILKELIRAFKKAESSKSVKLFIKIFNEIPKNRTYKLITALEQSERHIIDTILSSFLSDKNKFKDVSTYVTTLLNTIVSLTPKTEQFMDLCGDTLHFLMDSQSLISEDLLKVVAASKMKLSETNFFFLMTFLIADSYIEEIADLIINYNCFEDVPLSIIHCLVDKNIKKFADFIAPKGKKYTELVDIPLPIQNFAAFSSAIKSPNVSSYCLFKCFDSLKQVVEMFQNKKNIDLLKNNYSDVVKQILTLTKEILTFIPIPNDIDPIPNKTVEEILAMKLKVYLKYNDTKRSLVINGHSHFIELQGFLNKSIEIQPELKEKMDKLRFVAKQNTYENRELERLITFKINDVTYKQNYCFNINHSVFLTKQSILRSAIASMNDPNDLSFKVPVVTVYDNSSDITENPPLLYKDEKLSVLGDLIKNLDDEPSFDQNISDRFNKKIEMTHSSSVLGCSAAVAFVLSYPQLFSLNLRILCSYLINTTLQSACDAYLMEYEGRMCEKNYNTKFECEIENNRILNSGKLIFSYTRIPIIDCLISCNGTYMNNQVFMTDYSKAFFKSRKFNNYLMEKGLVYFYPGDDKQASFMLGILIARALLLHCTLEMKIHPCVFSLLKKKKVTFQEVSPELCDEFENVEWMDKLFVYPNHIEIKFGNEENINDNNFEEFKKCVIDRTVGEGVIGPLVKNIRTGFSSVLPLEFLDPFDGNELSQILYGEDTRITSEDLQTLDHSAIGKQTFDELCKVVNECSDEENRTLTYILTGAYRLPFGGFEKIIPKITLTTSDSIEYDQYKRVLYLPSSMSSEEIRKFFFNTE